MFDFVRTHTRLLQGILLLLIIPSFVAFGIQGYNRFNEGGNTTVAKVDGHAITQAEWDNAHARQMQRLTQQMPGIDPKLLDSPAMKRETLDQLVRERVLFAAANKLHLNTSDERVQRELMQIPQLATMKRADGSFDVDAYKALLAAQGMTPESFEASVRQEATLRQVTAGIETTAPNLAATAQAALDPLLQRREVQVQRFNTADFRSKVNPTDAELEAYYKAHTDAFRAPEQASIEYVVLDLDAIKAGITVSEDDLRKYYNENISRYTAAEERRASHILINAAKDAPAADKAKAKAKAEALLAEVRKAPGSFADVAKKNSDDAGSAARGGDLDFFERGAMVKPFEDAAFAMKPGEISNVVESDFGFHIIKLDAVRGGEKKPFEAVRGEIENAVKTQLAQQKYAEAAEQFTNMVYEQPDSLQPVVDKLKLKKQTATVQRTPAAGATGPLASAKLLDAVFGNDAVQNKRNTEAVEVGANQLATARVLQHTPARTQPLAEVKSTVQGLVSAEQASALARKAGEALLAQLKSSGETPMPAAITVSRAQSADLPRQVVDASLRADADKLPAIEGVDLGKDGFAVVRVQKVLPPDSQSPEFTQLKPRYAQAWGAAEGMAYYNALKSRFKVEIKAPAVAAPAGQDAPVTQ